jgi:hypothetical protein
MDVTGTIFHTASRDLPAGIDAERYDQLQARVIRDQGVQVSDQTVLPEEGMKKGRSRR